VRDVILAKPRVRDGLDPESRLLLL